MKVTFRVVEEGRGKELYECVLTAFREAKKADEWDLATLVVSEDRAEYVTCCGNVWWATTDGYFGYRGTRAGLLRLEPFKNRLRLIPVVCYDDVAVLEYVEEWEEVKVKNETEEVIRWERVPKRVRRFRLRVVEHETTTPPEWGVQWYEVVQRIPDTEFAVIVTDDCIIRRLVPYKNVYKQQQER